MNEELEQILEKTARKCGSCTECCKWLEGEVYGYSFYPGNPCQFLGECGCSIYEDRPDIPCKSYQCVWLSNKGIPEWMRPDLSGVIICAKKWNYYDEERIYFEVFETGRKIDSEVLAWLFDAHLNTKMPMVIYISGHPRAYGDEEFLSTVSV